ncbi:hypothetical protein [Anaerosalibacter sp. Marseille-P3206]|uniref:hypothetical protein n=1 Tax=Anaerosalibacter sp. Marseille-P3206 TaxID=1871005 RepID=UPI001F1B5F61|nr:hypothetical protein [Anaerosalibacter sp. Marseille-P3206]
MQLFLENLLVEKENLSEFFLPKDMPNFCCGCTNCFLKGEEFCPHHEVIAPIKTAMEKVLRIVRKNKYNNK